MLNNSIVNIKEKWVSRDSYLLYVDESSKDEVPKKLIELEDRSRHNNLLFDGLTQDHNGIGMTVNEKYRTSLIT